MYLARIPIATISAWVFDQPILWPFLGMIAAHVVRAVFLQMRFHSGRWIREAPLKSATG